MHAFADDDGALVRVSCLVISEQRGLAGAVGADHADDAAGGSLKVRSSIQHALAKALAEVFETRRLLAEPFGNRIVICAVWVCFSLRLFSSSS